MSDTPRTDTVDIISALRKKQLRILPDNWRVGKNCPNCGCSAERNNCAEGLGGWCPAFDPDRYDDAYQYVPDVICQKAADELTEARTEIANRAHSESEYQKEIADLRAQLAERDAVLSGCVGRIQELSAALTNALVIVVQFTGGRPFSSIVTQEKFEACDAVATKAFTLPSSAQADAEILAAAEAYAKGDDLLNERMARLNAGEVFDAADLDDIEVEKILASFALLKAVRSKQSAQEDKP